MVQWPDARVLVTGGSGFIGTHLVSRLRELGAAVCNLDLRSPNELSHLDVYRRCDILDPADTAEHFRRWRPTHVVHLAARVDTDNDAVEAYRANTDGTANVLAAVSGVDSVERLVVTSTQFVVRPGALPATDTDYDPHTAYGESKAIAERLTRDAELGCVWTIVRPTNIWGPWHPRYPQEFWRVLQRGLYLHPRGRRTVRSYGFVRNVVFQIERILEAPAEIVDREVFYLGDRPLLLDDYVHGFARALTGRRARTAPYAVLRTIALAGDAMQRLGWRAPLTSSRLRSMTEDYDTPMEKTIARFGEPPVSLQHGIDETVAWLRNRSGRGD